MEEQEALSGQVGMSWLSAEEVQRLQERGEEPPLGRVLAAGRTRKDGRRDRGRVKSPLLVEDAAVQESLRRIISRFTSEPAAQQDLMQECLVCLWKAEQAKPGRTRSWYLQHCRFHVQHCLALGRSLDSPKRANGDKRLVLDWTEEDPQLSEFHTNGELFDLVSFQDAVATLSGYLSPRERQVLDGLASGLMLREVATKFRLSYPTALKYRRRIAGLSVKLGIASARRRAASAQPQAKAA
jgi:DNA-directed RNA polymerase specialized sigma24 family protein